MEKFKQVTIKTPKGERKLEYQKVGEVPENAHVCNMNCVYGRACINMSDPRDPDNKEKKFNSFCAALGKEGSEVEDSELQSMVPVPGTIEKNLYDFPDVFQQIIKNDPQVKLSEIIDNVCVGFCDSYTEDKSNCNSSNKLCILHSLFLKPMEPHKVEPFDPDIELLERLDRERKEKEEAENKKDDNN